MRIFKNIFSITMCIFLIGTESVVAQSLKSQACTPNKVPDYQVTNLDELEDHPLVVGMFIASALTSPERDIDVVDCSFRDWEQDFDNFNVRNVNEDLKSLIGLNYEEYVGKILGYGSDSLVFLSWNNSGVATHSLLVSIGTSDLQSVFGVPVHLKSPFSKNSMNGYFIPSFLSYKKSGDVQNFSGKTHNYEVYFGEKGNVELYYQKKKGGSVLTARCRNEGNDGARRLAKTIMRNYKDMETEWYIAQCSSICSSDRAHRKKCSEFKSSYKDSYKYMDPFWN